MSAKDITDTYRGLSGPARHRAVDAARRGIAARLELQRTARVRREIARLIQEAARAIQGGRERVAS